MANGYMPRKDAAARDWMMNFAGGIGASPAAYMLSDADAATIRQVVDEFAEALAVTADSATKTKVTVRKKDQARRSAEQLIQIYYALLKPNAGISDAMKIAIGVKPENRSRSRINCPASSPVLNIVGNEPGQQILRFRDSNSPSSRGKPFGAAFLELRVAVGDAPIREVERARPVGLCTSNPVLVRFTHEDDCRKATYFGRWVSRRGEAGPWSNPVSMSIAA